MSMCVRYTAFKGAMWTVVEKLIYWGVRVAKHIP